MKKLLISIFWIFFWLSSFCSALTIQDPEVCVLYTWNIDWPDSVTFQDWNVSNAWSYVLAWNYDLTNWFPDMAILTQYWWEFSLDFYEESYYYYAMMLFPSEWCSQSWWWSSSSDITVFYDYGLSSSVIECDWNNSIYINSLAYISWTTFSPFFNINYVDQDNQIITNSYNKDMLYLSGWKFHKTYTWDDNKWILSVVNNFESSFTWYLPTFDVTWNITEIDTWNVFNNFAENSLTVLLSNIPNYIQYVIMFALLLFVLWIFRRLRK